MFDVWRFHAFFTTTDPAEADTVTADQIHRRHAIIEQVHADLKNSALAHLPSGKFAANVAWLTLATMAFNLTRAAATLAGRGLAKAITGTIRARLITVPARIASSARKLCLHLPARWPWQKPWETFYAATFGLPAPPDPDHPARAGALRGTPVEHPGRTVGNSLLPKRHQTPIKINNSPNTDPHRWIRG